MFRELVTLRVHAALVCREQAMACTARADLPWEVAIMDGRQRQVSQAAAARVGGGCRAAMDRVHCFAT
jgi:hypothetical protein